MLDVPVTIVSMWNTQRYDKWDLPLSPETSSAAAILYIFNFFLDNFAIYYTHVFILAILAFLYLQCKFLLFGHYLTIHRFILDIVQ